MTHRVQRASPPLPAANANRSAKGVRDPYHLLFALNPNPMFVFDERSLRFLAVNRAMIRLYGWSRHDFLRMSATDIRPPADIPLFLRALQRQRSAKAAFVGVWRHRKRDGTLFDVEVTISCLPFGGHDARLAMVRDITERKQSEQALTQQAQLLDLCHDAIFAWDLDGTIEYWNEGAERMYGYRRREAVGQVSHRLLATVFPAGFARFRQALVRHGEWSGEIRHTTRDGRQLVVQSRQQLIPREGRLLVLETTNDVTAYKQAEETIGNLVRDLEQRVKVRTAELRKSETTLLEQQVRLQHLATSLATARDEEQRRIAEGLHDDVAQLLTAASLKVAVAQQTATSEERDALLSETERLIGESTEKVRALSFELASSTLRRMGLRAALAELADTMQARHGVHFRLEGNATSVSLHETVATVLFKSARELMFNVVKHAGVREAAVLLGRQARCLRIVVQDHGVGFPAAASCAAHGRGSGLGLFAMQERLRALGGGMQVETQPGQGARVTIWLPVDSPRGRTRT